MITYMKAVGGNPTMVDYTSGGSPVNAGDVVVLGNWPNISHLDLAANTLGALALKGGIYDGPKASGDGGIADRARVFWDPVNHVITGTPTNNYELGTALGASLTGDTVQRFFHDPFYSVAPVGPSGP